jgi:hypothetical protein
LPDDPREGVKASQPLLVGRQVGEGIGEVVGDEVVGRFRVATLRQPWSKPIVITSASLKAGC